MSAEIEIKDDHGKFDFREWLRASKDPNLDFREIDSDHFEMNTEAATAAITFYKDDIVEIAITRKKDGEMKYYLHFQIRDEEHAKRLFSEMEDALKSIEDEKTLQVLLSCTSGVTTSFFASKLNEAAENMKLDIHFDAIPYFDLYDKAQDYDLVLIAPQIGYMEKRLQKSLPRKNIRQIPTQLFSAFDVLRTLEFVEHAVEKHSKKEEKEFHEEVRVHTCSCNDLKKKRVFYLIITSDSPQIRLFMNIIRGEEQELADMAVFSESSVSSLWDTIQYGITVRDKIDLICIALPGEVANYTTVHSPHLSLNHFDLGKYIRDTYGIPCIVSNNTNAAAYGYYGLNPEYKDICVISQPYGCPSAGQGNIVQGKLAEGLNGIAGESKYFIHRMQFSDSVDKLARTEQGQMELLIACMLPTISILGPEIFVLRTPMVNDMIELRSRLTSFIPERFIPKLEFLMDANHLTLYGLQMMADRYFEKKQKEKEEA